MKKQPLTLIAIRKTTHKKISKFAEARNMRLVDLVSRVLESYLRKREKASK